MSKKKAQASVVKQTIDETKVFLLGALKKPVEAGTFLPTSRWAAEAMLKPLRQFLSAFPEEKPDVLEIGPGAGSISKKLFEIREKLGRFVLVECNDFYSRYLKELAKKYNCEVEIINSYIQDVDLDFRPKFIICSVPFLAMNLQAAVEVFAKIRYLSGEDTILTFFEHVVVRKVKTLFNEKKKFFYEILEEGVIGKELIVRNYFPIRVFTVKPSLIRINMAKALVQV